MNNADRSSSPIRLADDDACRHLTRLLPFRFEGTRREAWKHRHLYMLNSFEKTKKRKVSFSEIYPNSSLTGLSCASSSVLPHRRPGGEEESFAVRCQRLFSIGLLTEGDALVHRFSLRQARSDRTTRTKRSRFSKNRYRRKQRWTKSER